MNILICDDDRQYVDLLNKYVTSFFRNHNIPDYNIYKYFSGEDVVKDMKYIDIAFLDVEMDGINGIEVGRRLRQKNPDIVIFIITSYMGYLDEPIYYLDEEVTDSRLQQLETKFEKVAKSIN